MCVASRIGLVAILLAACTAPDEPVGVRSQEVVAGKTVISLTFDDTAADNFQVGALTEARGMRATFFVNSGRVGQSGSLSLQQLIALEDAGHEIAGHTITHAHLTAISEDEARREICNDRASLLEGGFRITSFAYPFSDQNEAVQQIAEECGYNSARLVGGLVMPTSCNGCPYANPQSPPDPYAVRTNDSVDNTTTLDMMKLYVTQAEQHGGGWVPMVFHHVCDGCNELSITPAQLGEFLDWLKARSSLGTVVATVDQVIGGSVKPAVPGPIATSGGTGGTTNMIQNASLETDANGNQIPDCWQRGGSGTNSATYTLTNNAYDGSVAQRIDVTSLSSGARRLVTQQDSGACAPAAIAGHRYTVTARYLSNTQPVFTVYYRNASGSWVFLAQSPALPTASTYALGTYTTPALPSGATAISVGLSIIRVGSLTMDAFTLVDAAGGSTSDTTAPTVALTAPASGATISGMTQVSATATDAGGVARVELLANGSLIATDPTYPYWFAWDTSAFAGRSVTLAVRAVDLAGNAATSASRTVTVAAAPDTTPPTVALTSPAAGATVSGSVQVTATASDAGGIARVDVYANGALVGSDATSPYAVTWETASYAGTNVSLTAVAVDNAGNTTTSAARTVTVAAPADTTPPTVALTSPANGATITGTVTLSADAADAGGIARVEFFAGTTLIATELDAPYELAWDTTPYAGTTVSLTARAVDVAGNATTSAARTVTVQPAADTTPPAVTLTSPADGATVSGQVQMVADASDAGGINRVEFWINNQFMGDVRTPPYVLTWSSETYAGTTATVQVTAYDNAGNSSNSATHTVTVTTPTDTTAPTVALTSPADGATVSGTVTLSADAADNVGVARVDFFVNNEFLIASELNAPYELSWDTSAYAGQTISLTARAVDTVGNETISAARTVTVRAVADTTPPTVVVTAPATGGTVSGTVTVAADANDAGGIARVDFFANGVAIGSDTTSPYAISWDTSSFSGQVAVTARAVDNAGNATTSNSNQITVAPPSDTTLPTAVLTAPADGATVTGTVTVSANATDNVGVARVEFLANGTVIATDTTSPYSTSWNTAAYAGTSVSLTARAVDTSGNVATSVARTVTVQGAASTNLIQNPSLETDANGDQVPDCWQRGSSGTNSASYTLTSNAFTGVRAQRIDMTSYSSGARRIVTRQDSGACAPAAVAGHRYTVTARYLGNVAPVFTIYYRNASGSWVFFAQSPAQSQSSSYRLGTYTTAPLPAGATHISVGLSIISLGSLTMDDFTLVDAGP